MPLGDSAYLRWVEAGDASGALPCKEGGGPPSAHPLPMRRSLLQPCAWLGHFSYTFSVELMSVHGVGAAGRRRVMRSAPLGASVLHMVALYAELHVCAC